MSPFKDFNPIPPRRKPGEFDEDNITTYDSTVDIWRNGRFSAEERKEKYRRRGKSPSGVIDGEYNDEYVEDGMVYNDEYRDWEADA